MAEEKSVLQMMRMVREWTETLAASAPTDLAAPDLTRNSAESILDSCQLFLSQVDLLIDAIDEKETGGEVNNPVVRASARFAEIAHGFGTALHIMACEQVKRLGGDPIKYLDEAQRRHH